MIMARETFYHAEAIYSVIVSLLKLSILMFRTYYHWQEMIK